MRASMRRDNSGDQGREAIERTIETGSAIPAEEVIAKLQAKVDAARQRQAQAIKTVP